MDARQRARMGLDPMGTGTVALGVESIWTEPRHERVGPYNIHFYQWNQWQQLGTRRWLEAQWWVEVMRPVGSNISVDPFVRRNIFLDEEEARAAFDKMVRAIAVHVATQALGLSTTG